MRGLLILGDSKTGKSLRPLGAATIALLKSIDKTDGSDFAFPAERGDGHYQGIKTMWSRAIAKASCPASRPIHSGIRWDRPPPRRARRWRSPARSWDMRIRVRPQFTPMCRPARPGKRQSVSVPKSQQRSPASLRAGRPLGNPSMQSKRSPAVSLSNSPSAVSMRSKSLHWWAKLRKMSKASSVWQQPRVFAYEVLDWGNGGYQAFTSAHFALDPMSSLQAFENL